MPIRSMSMVEGALRGCFSPGHRREHAGQIELEMRALSAFAIIKVHVVPSQRGVWLLMVTVKARVHPHTPHPHWRRNGC
jgi:hypothetical protein